MIGGNASAEGGAEEAEDVSESGCNIVLANRLQETGFDKKAFQAFIKVFIYIIWCLSLKASGGGGGGGLYSTKFLW